MTSPSTYKLGFPKLKYSVAPVASGSPFQRDPTTSDLLDTKVGGPYQIGTFWPNTANNTLWAMLSVTSGSTANWYKLTNALVSTGAAATKGSITLTAGTHAKILTTAAVTGAVIVYTVTALGTVTVASAFLTTIDNGVGFTPVASQVTDTSTVTWAIIG